MVSNFKKKQKGLSGKKMWVPFVALALLVVVGILIVADIKMYQKKATLNAQVSSLQHKIAELKTKNTDLQQGISESSNSAYIEKVAREELDLQKPGEQVVSFIPPQNPAPQPAANQNNFLQSWLGWIGGWFRK